MFANFGIDRTDPAQHKQVRVKEYSPPSPVRRGATILCGTHWLVLLAPILAACGGGGGGGGPETNSSRSGQKESDQKESGQKENSHAETSQKETNQPRSGQKESGQKDETPVPRDALSPDPEKAKTADKIVTNGTQKPNLKPAPESETTRTPEITLTPPIPGATRDNNNGLDPPEILTTGAIPPTKPPDNGVASAETPQDSASPDKSPPAGTPPAGTPPVETPPVNTPVNTPVNPLPSNPRQDQETPRPEIQSVKAGEERVGEASPPATNQQVPAPQAPGGRVTAIENVPGPGVTPNPETGPRSTVTPDTTTTDITTNDDNGRQPAVTVSPDKSPPAETPPVSTPANAPVNPLPSNPRQDQETPRPEIQSVKAGEERVGEASPPATNQQVPAPQVPGGRVTTIENVPGPGVTQNPKPGPRSTVTPDTTTTDITENPKTVTPGTTTARDATPDRPPVQTEPKSPVDYNTPPPRRDESEDKPKKASEKELNFIQSDELDGETYNAPTATPEDSVSVVEDTELLLNTRYFGFADADDDALLDILIMSVSGGQLVLDGDVIIIPAEGIRLASSAVSSYAIKPDANSENPISVKYQLRDETYLESETQTFVISVEARNDAPEWAANQQRFLLIEETAAGTTPEARATGFFAKAYDVEGQALTYSVVDDARFFFVENELWIREGVVLDGDYTPDSESLPYFTLRVRASDGEATSSDLEVLIRVTDQADEALQVDAISNLQVAENSTVLSGTAQLSVATREADPEVEYRLAGGVTHEFVTISSAGVVSLHTPPDYEAVRQISFAVEARHVIAGQGAKDGWQEQQQISITIGNRNDEALSLDATAAVDVAEGVMDTGHVVSAAVRDAAGGDVTYAITSGVDHKRFTIDPTTGILRFSTAKKITDHEKPRDLDKDNVYELVVTATSASRVSGDMAQSATQTVRVTITDINDEPPVFVDDVPPPVREDVAVHDHATDKGGAQVIHRVQATADVNGVAVVYSLKPVDDHAVFGIDAKSGEIWFRQPPDHESGKTIFEVIVVADAGGLRAERSLQFTVTDINDDKPVVTSGGTARVDENIAAHDDASDRGDAVVVYQAMATKDDVGPDVGWQLGGDDASAFGINDQGEIWFRQPPDHETKASYSITVTALSGDIASKPKPVIIAIGNIDEHGPVFTRTTMPAAQELSASLRAEHLAVVKATDADGDDVVYILAPDRSTNDNHLIIRPDGNRLSKDADGGAQLRFKAGTFDYEAARVDPDTGERYFLVDLRAHSTHPGASRRKAVETIKLVVEDDGVLPALSVTPMERTLSAKPVYNLGFKTFGWNELHDGSTEIDIFLRIGASDSVQVARSIESKNMVRGSSYFRTEFIARETNLDNGILINGGINLVYQPHQERGSGAPLNRLRDGESLQAEFTFFARDQLGRVSGDQTVRFDVAGRENRPILIEYGTPLRPATVERPWDWWQMNGVWYLERYARDPLATKEEITLDEGGQSLWRFMLVDEDGGALSGEGGYLRMDGESDAAYLARLKSFINGKAKILHKAESWPIQQVDLDGPDLTSLFEVVPLVGAGGAPVTTPMPGMPGVRIPVFELRFREPVDFEAHAGSLPIYINLRLNDIDGSKAILQPYVDKLFAITIGNRLDEAVAMTPPKDDLLVAETASAGSLIGQLAATTAEVGDKAIRFEVVGNNARFAVADDGTITLKTKIDYEALTEEEREQGVPLTVRAVMSRDGETDIASEAMTIRIFIHNRNDQPMSWDLQEEVTIDEGNTHTGLNIRTAVKHDASGRPVRYEIVDPAMQAIFEIAASGELVFKTAPDIDNWENQELYGKPITHNVRLRAVSDSIISGDAEQSVERSVLVTVVNILDEKPLTIPLFLMPPVQDDAPAGTVVARLARSAREAPPVETHFEIVGSNRFFTVDSGGEVRLKVPGNFEALTEEEQTRGVPVSIRSVHTRGDETPLAGDATTLWIKFVDVDHGIELTETNGVFTVSHREGETASVGLYGRGAIRSTKLLGWDENRPDDNPFQLMTGVVTPYGKIMLTEVQPVAIAPPGRALQFSLKTVADHHSPDYQALAMGQQTTVSFALWADMESGNEQQTLAVSLNFTGVNDVPVARAKSVAMPLNPETVFTVDESWFDIIEHDIDPATGQPEEWTHVTISNVRGGGSFRWSGNWRNPDGNTTLLSNDTVPLSTIVAEGWREIIISREDLHKLTFVWTEDALAQLRQGILPEIGFTYSVTDKHGGISAPATVRVQNTSEKPSLVTDTPAVRAVVEDSASSGQNYIDLADDMTLLATGVPEVI